jgi:DNA-binding MarR family transcriptional regulator
MSQKIPTHSKLIREPIPMPEPDNPVPMALKEVLRALHKVMESRRRSRGDPLSFPHTMLLGLLAREPGLSGAQVARRSQVTAQTMNELLRNVESAGYAAREPNPENRRADRWFLTQKGAGYLEKDTGVANQVIRDMLGPLSAKDIEKLCELLGRCTQALRAVADPKDQATQ